MAACYIDVSFMDPDGNEVHAEEGRLCISFLKDEVFEYYMGKGAASIHVTPDSSDYDHYEWDEEITAKYVEIVNNSTFAKLFKDGEVQVGKAILLPEWSYSHMLVVHSLCRYTWEESALQSIVRFREMGHSCNKAIMLGARFNVNSPNDIVRCTGSIDHRLGNEGGTATGWLRDIKGKVNSLMDDTPWKDGGTTTPGILWQGEFDYCDETSFRYLHEHYTSFNKFLNIMGGKQ